MAIESSSILNLYLNLIYLELDTAYITLQQFRRVLSPADATKYRFINAKSKKEVILLPGVYEPWQIMKPIADSLVAAGYHVHVLPELGYNVATINDTALSVQTYMDTHQLNHVAIVAHSKGGLIAKTLLLQRSIRKRIYVAICINTPFAGSIYARFIPVKSLSELKPTSETITKLAAVTKVNGKIVSMYGLFDPQIPDGTKLEGATNIQLMVRGHYLPLRDKRVLGEIKSQLEISAKVSR